METSPRLHIIRRPQLPIHTRRDRCRTPPLQRDFLGAKLKMKNLIRIRIEKDGERIPPFITQTYDKLLF